MERRTGAVIAAAGLSSRMGEFKPMLPFGDSTIILHIVTQLIKLGVEPIMVITGCRAEELERHLFHTGVRFLKNERYEETEMFDSVRMGIRAVSGECDRILLMPADMPAILPETYQQMLKVDAEILRPVFEGHPGHPVLVRSETAEKLCAYQGDDGLRGAIREAKCPVTNLEVDDWGICLDMDTREDYELLLQRDSERGREYPVHPQVKVWLAASENFYGPGTDRLLRMIDRTGSIQKACAEMGLSYSKGSRMVKTVERQLGFPVVQRRAGGLRGGGSSLTEEGRRLIRNYEELVRQVRESTETCYRECFAKGLRG